MPDALGALYASRISSLKTMSSEDEQREHVKAFLSRFPEHLEYPQKMEDIEELSRFYFLVDAFVADCSHAASIAMSERKARTWSSLSMADLKFLPGIPLTTVESTRFQRAFYRFEIYCTCFRRVRD